MSRPPTVGQAIARGWPLVLVLMIVLGAGGALLGRSHAPTYEAATRLNVGSTQLSTRSIPGFAEGTSALAGVYSRIVTSEQIVDEAAHRAGISRGAARARLSASPIASSSSFAIHASGPTEREAVALANAATAAFMDVTRKQAAQATGASTALRRAKAAATRLAEAQAELDRRSAALGSRPTRAERAAVVQAKADVSAERLRSGAAATIYRQRLEAQSDPAGQQVIQVLDRARSAADDHRSWIQRGGLTGVIVGLLLGSGLAVLVARRRSYP